jgi:hypothetical protein
MHNFLQQEEEQKKPLQGKAAASKRDRTEPSAGEEMG